MADRVFLFNQAQIHEVEGEGAEREERILMTLRREWGKLLLLIKMGYEWWIKCSFARCTRLSLRRKVSPPAVF